MVCEWAVAECNFFVRPDDVGKYGGVHEVLEAAGAQSVMLRKDFRARAKDVAHGDRPP
jgi:hypothetical protein